MTFLKSQMPISTFYSLLCLIRILDTLMYYVSLPPKLFGFLGAQRSHREIPGVDASVPHTSRDTKDFCNQSPPPYINGKKVAPDLTESPPYV